MNGALWLLALVIAESPLLLLVLKDGFFDRCSFIITSAVVIVELIMPFFDFGDPSVVWKLFLAQVLLFSSFVCVSRIRQRKSLFLMALASIVSNGGWFLAVQVLAGAYLSAEQGIGISESIGLLVSAVAGALVGRLVGVQWAIWMENRWQIRLNSVGSTTIRWLDSYTQPIIGILLLGCLFVYGTIGLVPIRDLLITTALGFAQNAVHTINERLANRNHPGWPVLTGLLSGIIFIVNWTFLMGYTKSGGFMPVVLLIPYTLATVAGGNLSADLSMALERLLNLGADAHVLNGESYAEVTWHKTVLLVTAVSCAAYLVASEYVLRFFGLTTHMIVLPFKIFAGMDFERPASLFLGGALFFASNVTQTLSSRAGNRNNAPYHAVTCLMHGLVTFGTGTFVVLNARFLDLIPVAALGSSLGQLFAQRWSMRVERWLGSVMEVEGEWNCRHRLTGKRLATKLVDDKRILQARRATSKGTTQCDLGAVMGKENS